jgi:hypothetical protein
VIAGVLLFWTIGIPVIVVGAAAIAGPRRERAGPTVPRDERYDVAR